MGGLYTNNNNITILIIVQLRDVYLGIVFCYMSVNLSNIISYHVHTTSGRKKHDRSRIKLYARGPVRENDFYPYLFSFFFFF